METVFFYLFSAVLLFSAFRVITARNPVHAVLFLMLAFSQASGIWLLLKAEFLAIVLVLVYLGAVMVLFLFVVMMLDISFDSLRQGFWRHLPVGLVIGGLVVVEMAGVLTHGFRGEGMPAAVATAASVSNSKALGALLYTKYLYPVQIAAVILLVAMVAAIALALRERKDSKKVDPSVQVRARARGRVELLNMEAVRPRPPAPETPPQEAAKP
ncbi:MAG: NADH-quinone oxidoreductase subunit J [Burkholderiaceae bacterium]|jgi:NADH-quinone oxidoreductase subunit J|nr:NADH-quinone oxidoreductase subunit J [Burkholderiaceae bacterium]